MCGDREVISSLQTVLEAVETLWDIDLSNKLSVQKAGIPT